MVRGVLGCSIDVAYLGDNGPSTRPSLFYGRAVPPGVPGEWPRHDPIPWAAPTRARCSPGHAVLVPGQNVVLRVGLSCPGLHAHLY